MTTFNNSICALPPALSDSPMEWVVPDYKWNVNWPWADPEPYPIEPSSLPIALFLPGVGGIAVTITLPIARLIFS